MRKTIGRNHTTASLRRYKRIDVVVRIILYEVVNLIDIMIKQGNKRQSMR